MALNLGQAVLGAATTTGKPLCLDDAHLDQRFAPSIDRGTGFTTESLRAVPITTHDEFLGVLEVINKRGRTAFTDEDSGQLEVVATQAVGTIANSRLI